MAGSKILSDENVKSPNLIERAKEEIQAVLNSDRFHFRQRNDTNEHTTINHSDQKIDQSAESKRISNHHHRRHQRETHGRRDDIDENTRIDEIKGPSIFQRAKEEVEALFGTIHPKKEPSDSAVSSSNSAAKEGGGGGFGGRVGRGLEKVCSGEIGASIGRGLEKVCSSNSKGNKPD